MWKPGASAGGATYPATLFGYTYGVGEEGFVAQNNYGTSPAWLHIVCSATEPVEEVGICHRTASDSNPYVYIEVSDMATANSHILNLASGHPEKYWKYDGVFLGAAHSAGDPKDDYLAESEEDCFDEEIVVNEPCGRCSNSFVGWVTWVDRDGGCDDDYYNERVEYPFDARCYGSCQEGNMTDVETFDSGWYDTGVPYGFGPWYANPLPPNFQREGSQDQLRDYAGNVVDVNSQEVCGTYDNQDAQTIPFFENEIAEKNPRIKTGSDCDQAWAWVRYFDPDGNKFIDGPKEYKPWVLSVYEPEFVEILGKTIHKPDECLSDIPEEPLCPAGNPTITSATFNYETGKWEGLECSPCRAVPVIEYIIQGEDFKCILYGNAKDGDTIYELPTDVIWMMNNGVCDLSALSCIPGREEPFPFVRNESGQFSGKKVTTCYEVEPCINCEGELVYPMNPLDVLR